MRIGINGQNLLEEHYAGPEVYTFNIINGLAKVDTVNSYVIYFTSEPSGEFFLRLTNGNPNFSYRVVSQLGSWTQVGLALELLKNPVDVFFTAVHTMPIIRRPSLRTVGMIHGLEYTFSEEYKNPLKKFLIGKPEWFVCAFSDAIITPSEATKEAILQKKWPLVNEKKIKIVHEGVDSSFYPRSEPRIKEIREKYGLGADKYLLFVSTIQPRKNIPAMVEAYSLAVREHPELENTRLAVVGKKGWLYEESLRSPQKYNVEDKVLFLGRVSSSDLPPLFSGAHAYISCSLEEGFGLPLLEAMACETQAIVSNISAFKEIGKDIPYYVDPTNVQDIKETIIRVLSSQKDTERVQKGKVRAREFSWESSAEKTLRVFENVIKHL
jgi:glycosyltransferase involved in cell wall biosynthesis